MGTDGGGGVCVGVALASQASRRCCGSLEDSSCSTTTLAARIPA